MSNHVHACSNFMRKIRIGLPLALAASVALAGHAVVAQATVSTIVTPSQAKPYVALVNGTTQIPYLMYGVQLRIDALIGPNYPGWTAWNGTGNGDDGIDKYFSMANVAGFKTVIVPVPWRYVESNSTAGQYNFDYIHNIIASAYAHSLKVQLLWYGSDVCGISDAPDYVMQTPGTYPRLTGNTVFLDLSKTATTNAESSALQAMMYYVAHNDPNQTVVVLGIENEPDGCSPSATQPSNWNNAASLAPYMYAGGQYTAVVNLVNKLANDAKTQWSGVTRCNLGYSYRTVDFANDRARNGTGVDMLGVDLYTNDFNSSSQFSTHNVVAQLTPSPIFASLNPSASITSIAYSTTLPYGPPPTNMSTNVAHQPEGGGQYANYDNLMLSNFADGAGELIYELRTLQWTQNGQLNPSYDLGVYRATPTKSSWTARDGSIQVPYNIQGTVMGPEGKTSDIQDFNTLIYKADKKIAVTYPGRCIAFLNPPSGGTAVLANIGGTNVQYQTWDGKPAFAIKDANGDIIFLNLSHGSVFTITDTGYPAVRVSEGWYDANNAWYENSVKSSVPGTRTVTAFEKDCIRFVHQ